MTTLVIVRHGNTFDPGEPPRRIGARTDLPLVESGQRQADALGAAFAAKGWRFDRVLVSPLSRTRETAARILLAQPAPPSPEPCDWLAEIDHGPDENQTEAAVLTRIGAEALTAWDERGIAPEGWQVDGERRAAGWRDLFARNRDAEARILLVTSNGAARFIFRADPRLAEQAHALPSLKLRTGAWGCIRLSSEMINVEAWDERP